MSHNTQSKLIAAFRRLQSGSPTNPELAERAARGKLVINASTVALEASVSRTPIASRQKGYEEICALLYPDEIPTGTASSLGYRQKSPLKTASVIIANLRAEKRDLAEQRAQFATLLTETAIALELKEKRIRSLEAEVARLRRSIGLTPHLSSE